MAALLPYGDRAVLVECDDDHPGRLAERLRSREMWQGSAPIDVVPGARTILLTFAQPAESTEIGGVLDRAREGVRAEAARTSEVVEIEVVYDGEDLPALAEETGRAVEEIIASHSAAAHVVDFCGFAPGFAYMSGLPEWMHVARLATPRTRVPAGSVAIAAGWSAVYPGDSPGGWRLIGRTDAVMFDPDRAQPALLPPGTEVRFVPR